MNSAERFIMNFVILLIVILCILYGIFFYIWIKNYKLDRYLKSNNYERWKYLSMIGKFGPGLANPFKGIPYIYGTQDNNDEVILRRKIAIRRGIRYFLITLGTIPLIVAIIAVLIKMSK